MFTKIYATVCEFFIRLVNLFTITKSEAREPRTIKEFRDLAERGDPLYQYKLATLLLTVPTENRQFGEILKWLTSAANSGYNNAKILLGLLFKNGYGVLFNLQTAISWFQNAAELGDTEALVQLAALENEGTYTPKDPKILEEALRNSAQKGNPFAQFNLAYRLSKGPKENLKEVTAWAQKAKEGLQKIAEKDDVFAQYDLGFMLQEGIGVPKDPTNSLKFYKKAAKLGLAKAQFKAGIILLNSKEVPQNREEGITWIKKAADQKLLIAEEKLDELFLQGHHSTGLVFPKYLVKSKDWLHKAAKHAQDNFLLDMGTMLLTGKCLPCEHRKGPGTIFLPLPRKEDFQPFLGDELSDFFAFSQDPTLKDKLLQKALEEENSYAQVMLGYINSYDKEPNTGNFPEAAKWFEKAADQGNVLGQVAISLLLFAGRGITKNYPEAISYTLKAVDQGNSDALNYLATAFYYGYGVPQDKYAARHLFLKEANDKDNLFAQFSLGRWVLFGDDIFPPNHWEAVEYFKKTAEKGMDLADFYLGFCYAQGAGVSQNPQLAVAGFEKPSLVLKYLPDLYLGVAHIIGFGVPKDIEKGSQCLIKSADQNSQRALLFMVTLSLLGLIQFKTSHALVKKVQLLAEAGDDLFQYCLAMWSLNEFLNLTPMAAGTWVQKAADLGNVYAINFLGLMFANGIGFPVNYAIAADHFREAAEKGHADAQFNLSVMYFDGLGVKQNPKEGILWLQKAANLGQLNAQYLLGTFYLAGVVVPKVPLLGVSWLQKAANLEQINAQSLLGVLYAEGKVVPKDLNEAIKWLEKAAERGDTKIKEMLKTLKS
ncbi:MAG: hypothetical protein LBF22_15210 [Deltaproteobacteria bacterium]|jgi:TPR repeat protein|nr:hypothetical protein [Deltaproteobacteria bacterium]